MPGLYQISSNNANVAVTNTTGLYIGNGAASILNNASLLLSLLDNNGNVNFALDPATGNTTIYSYFVGTVGTTYGNADVAAYLPINSANVAASYFIGDGSLITNLPAGNYSNVNVAAYLPTYTGSLALSSTIIDLYSNAASQQTSINTLNANLGAFETYANATFGTSSYGNANVAAYLPTNSSNVAGNYFIGNGSKLTNLTGAAAGVYGSDVLIPSIVVDATGRITGITTNTVSGGGSYGNANVAAYLPTYTGSLALSSTIVALNANIGTLFLGNASTNANLGAYQTYANATNATTQANIGTLFLGNASTNANLGAYQIYANANAAVQAVSINTINANLGAFQTYSNVTNATTQANIGTLFLGNASTNANLGAFQTYANATFGTSNYSNVNVAAYLPTYTGSLALSSTIIDLYSNAASQQTSINTINANLGAFQTYSNVTNATTQANIGTLFLGNASTNANLGAFQTYANANFGTSNYSNVNVAAYLPTYTGSLALSSTIVGIQANIGTLFLGNASTNANLGAYQTYANANAAAQATSINTINANLGAFETYANTTFITSATQYSNVNVAAYLPTYTGNIGNANIFNSNLGMYSGNITIYANSPGQYGGLVYIRAANTTPASGMFGEGRIGIQAANIELTGDGAPTNKITFSTKVIATGGQTDTTGPNISSTGNSITAYAGNISASNSNEWVVTGNSYATPFGGYIYASNNISAAANLNAGNYVNGISGAFSATVSALSFTTTNGVFYANGVNILTPITAGIYSNSNVASYLTTYNGNIGNVNIKSGTQYHFGGNLNLTANSAGTSYISLNAGNATTSYSGTIGLNASQVGIGSGTDAGSQVALYGYTTITSANTVPNQNSGNVLTVVQGNVNLINFNNAGGNVGNWGGYLFASNNINAAGNVSGNRIITTLGVFWSNGTAYAGSYGNAQVAQYLASNTDATISNLNANAAVQAVSINTINANLGAFQTYANSTFVTTSNQYGNTQVAAYLPTYTGNIAFGTATAANVSFTGNIVGFGNILATNYFLGDGSKLTNISASPYGIYTGGGSIENDGFQSIVGPAVVMTPFADFSGPIIGLADTSANPDLTSGSSTFLIGLDGATAFASGKTVNGVFVPGLSTAFQSNVSTLGFDINQQAGWGNVYVVTTNDAVESSIYKFSNIGLQFPDGTEQTTAYTGGGSGYGNTQVAAFLPTYTGSLALSSTIVGIQANVGTLFLGNASTNANIGAFQTYANTTFYKSGSTITAANIITTNGVFWANGTAYSTGGGGGGSNFTSNLTVNGNYIIDANLSIIREKFANIGTINGTVTIDANVAIIQAAVVASNITINTNNFTNLGIGQTITLKLRQATNANLRILTSNVLFAGGSKTLSTANAAVDTLSITYDGENYLGALVKGYS